MYKIVKELVFYNNLSFIIFLVGSFLLILALPGVTGSKYLRTGAISWSSSVCSLTVFLPAWNHLPNTYFEYNIMSAFKIRLSTIHFGRFLKVKCNVHAWSSTAVSGVFRLLCHWHLRISCINRLIALTD